MAFVAVEDHGLEASKYLAACSSASTRSSSLFHLLHQAKNLSVSSIVALFIAFIAMASAEVSQYPMALPDQHPMAPRLRSTNGETAS